MRSFIFVLSMIALGSGLMGGLPAQAEQEGLLVAAKTTSLYDFTMDDIDGQPVNLGAYKGKVLLLVNTASLCGNTPQYSDLERVYEQFHEQGFEVLAFPANNFGQQEPGSNAEIKGFCLTKYSVSFPLFSKISVKGQAPALSVSNGTEPIPGRSGMEFSEIPGRPVRSGGGTFSSSHQASLS